MRRKDTHEIRDDFDREQVRNAQREFEAAESGLNSALRKTEKDRDNDYNMRFADAQTTIERSTKAVFELLDVQYPAKHTIDPRSREGRNLLHAVSAAVDDVEYLELREGLLSRSELKRQHIGEVARLLFLCYLFGDVYGLAKYGIQEEDIRVPATDIIQFSEQEYAIEYALVALRISDVIIDSIATGELPYVDSPTGDGPLEKRSEIVGNHYGVKLPGMDFDPVNEYRREL
ncbi:hypothetical protein PM022_15250 [Halorubrum ezzemoulense]|uniref:hypothetical protein n=1 Tax=Halorubrum ezzemoulense TaxID=337243 RepID=UPI0023304233|nr:hypothetical protein [Halorubrum ezzemoulense]MDB2275872.1 hypothetical protein [Halorubrum ezzemoulense]